jgi:hypothetical protein
MFAGQLERQPHGAAISALRREHAGVDVRVVDDRPDLLTTVPGRDDLVELCRTCRSTTAKRPSTVRPEAAIRAPQGGLDLRDGGGDIGWYLLPIRT